MSFTTMPNVGFTVTQFLSGSQANEIHLSATSPALSQTLRVFQQGMVVYSPSLNNFIFIPLNIPPGNDYQLYQVYS